MNVVYITYVGHFHTPNNSLHIGYHLTIFIPKLCHLLDMRTNILIASFLVKLSWLFAEDTE